MCAPGVERAAQQRLALDERHARQVVAVEVEQVEDVEVHRRLGGGALDLGRPREVDPRLQLLEARHAVLVHRDDLAVEHRACAPAAPRAPRRPPDTARVIALPRRLRRSTRALHRRRRATRTRARARRRASARRSSRRARTAASTSVASIGRSDFASGNGACARRPDAARRPPAAMRGMRPSFRSWIVRPLITERSSSSTSRVEAYSSRCLISSQFFGSRADPHQRPRAVQLLAAQRERELARRPMSSCMRALPSARSPHE